MSNIISLKNVYFSYTDYFEDNKNDNNNSDNEKQYILRDLSFDISKGEFVSIIGHNGSGKSTLSKLFNSLLMPTKGEVIINSHISNEENIINIRKSCGLVFQNPDNALVSSIVEDDIAFGPENLGLSTEEINNRVNEAIKVCSLENFRKFDPSKLSGGQKQRVAIAGVLALKPEIIVFDEATSMLDPKGKIEILELIKKLNLNGTTIINITHNLEETLISDRILMLDKGKIVYSSDPYQLYTNDKLVSEYDVISPFIYKISNSINVSSKQNEDELIEEILKEIR